MRLPFLPAAALFAVLPTLLACAVAPPDPTDAGPRQRRPDEMFDVPRAAAPAAAPRVSGRA